MAKYCGKIGYINKDEEVVPGVWEKTIKERTYYGDIISISRNTKNSSDTDHDSFKINAQLSVISDPFARNNFDDMVYAIINGVKWKIEGINFNFPRMTIDLGGIYHDIREQED